MFNWLKGIGSIIIILLVVPSTTAQIVGTYKKLELGIGAGLTFYSGDVAPTPNIKNTRGGAEAFFRYNFNPAVSGRLTLGGYSIAGIDENRDDPFQKVRSHSFASRVIDASAMLEYNFFNFRGNKPFPKFSPYIFAGLGIMRADIKYENSGISPGERKAKASIPGATTIPFGVGVKFPFTKKFNVAWELRATKTFTDHLDMLGTTSNQSNDRRFEYGNVEGKDMYLYLGFSIAYRFVTLKCPKNYPSRDYDFK